jgi:hypothetical protein
MPKSPSLITCLGFRVQGAGFRGSESKVSSCLQVRAGGRAGDLLAGGQKDVLRLEIAVQDLAVVHVLEREAYLHKPVGDLVLVKELAAAGLEHACQVAALRKRHDNAQLALVLEALTVLDDVWVLQRAQDGALLARRIPLLLVAARDIDHFDDEVLARAVALCQECLAKRALAQELALGVLADCVAAPRGLAHRLAHAGLVKRKRARRKQTQKLECLSNFKDAHGPGPSKGDHELDQARG